MPEEPEWLFCVIKSGTFLKSADLVKYKNNNVKFERGKAPDNLMWKCDVQKEAWNNLKGWYDIVALNVGKNMWYPDYGTKQHFYDVKEI